MHIIYLCDNHIIICISSSCQAQVDSVYQQAYSTSYATFDLIFMCA